MMSLLRRRLAPKSAPPKAGARSGGLAGAPANVIIVEDELSLQSFLGLLVQKAGLTYALAGSLDDVKALEIGRSASLVLLDLALDRSDAIDVLRHLANLGFSGPIVLMSGHDAAVLDYVQKLGQQQGLNMQQPLHKPFKADTLKSILANFGSSSARPVLIDFETVMRLEQMEVWYQPKVHLGSFRIEGMEALVRIRDPQEGLLLPGQFLGQLSDANMAQLTAFVLQRMIRDWQSLADAGFALKPSMNVRTRELLSPALLDILKSSRPTDPRWSGMIMELTDPKLVDEVEAVREAVVRLQLQKVQLALDDFGDVVTRQVKCPELKLFEININRKFVNGCATDRNRHAICQAAVLFARRLRLRVVAEGIERAEDLEAVKALGCDAGQGNLFAAAMQLPLLEELLKRGEPLYSATQVGRARDADPLALDRSAIAAPRSEPDRSSSVPGSAVATG